MGEAMVKRLLKAEHGVSVWNRTAARAAPLAEYGATVKERVTKLGADPFPLTQDQFNAFIKTEMEAAARIAKAANLKAQ